MVVWLLLLLFLFHSLAHYFCISTQVDFWSSRLPTHVIVSSVTDVLCIQIKAWFLIFRKICTGLANRWNNSIRFDSFNVVGYSVARLIFSFSLNFRVVVDIMAQWSAFLNVHRSFLSCENTIYKPCDNNRCAINNFSTKTHDILNSIWILCLRHVPASS